ncbi:MAG: PrgI family protein, partial [Patescibacteria group bacterium]
MDQFVVPQFIDVEDKIFGPVTTRQFVILLVAGLVLFVAYKLADLSLFIFFLATIGGSALILAFVKINGQSFHYFLLNLFQTLRRPSRRVWYKMNTKEELQELRKGEKVVEMEKVAEIPSSRSIKAVLRP